MTPSDLLVTHIFPPLLQELDHVLDDEFEEIEEEEPQVGNEGHNDFFIN